MNTNDFYNLIDELERVSENIKKGDYQAVHSKLKDIIKNHMNGITDDLKQPIYGAYVECDKISDYAGPESKEYAEEALRLLDSSITRLKSSLTYRKDGGYANMKLDMDNIVNTMLSIGWKFDEEFDECKKLHPHLKKSYSGKELGKIFPVDMRINISYDPIEKTVDVFLFIENILFSWGRGGITVTLKDENLDFCEFADKIIGGIPKGRSTEIYRKIFKKLICDFRR